MEAGVHLHKELMRHQTLQISVCLFSLDDDGRRWLWERDGVTPHRDSIERDLKYHVVVGRPDNGAERRHDAAQSGSSHDYVRLQQWLQVRRIHLKACRDGEVVFGNSYCFDDR